MNFGNFDLHGKDRDFKATDDERNITYGSLSSRYPTFDIAISFCVITCALAPNTETDRMHTADTHSKSTGPILSSNCICTPNSEKVFK